MYTMKETCNKVNMTYGTLKFYCNEGLVPNVKRDKNNYRVFNDEDVDWISNLHYLKKCGMSIKEMKEYLALSFEGEKTIPIRKEILAKKQAQLEIELEEKQSYIDFIKNKQQLYDDILNGQV